MLPVDHISDQPSKLLIDAFLQRLMYLGYDIKLPQKHPHPPEVIFIFSYSFPSSLFPFLNLSSRLFCHATLTRSHSFKLFPLQDPFRDRLPNTLLIAYGQRQFLARASSLPRFCLDISLLLVVRLLDIFFLPSVGYSRNTSSELSWSGHRHLKLKATRPVKST